LIDYIIVHELVHLQEPLHSPEFWRAIDRALPAGRQLQEALRNNGARFLVFGIDSLRRLP
jgi:predicted metal-dependent hydrolase